MLSSLAMAFHAHGKSRRSRFTRFLGCAAAELEVVDNQEVKAMRPLEEAGAGGELRDGQRGRVVDIERAGLERFGGIDEAAEFSLGHVALADLLGGHFGGLGENPRGELFRRSSRASRTPRRRPRPRLRCHRVFLPFLIGLGDVEGDVGGERGFWPIEGASGEDQEV